MEKLQRKDLLPPASKGHLRAEIAQTGFTGGQLRQAAVLAEKSLRDNLASK
jgi:hypothetical protein